MDYRRANEIVSSPDMADVTYENKPVYMEMVNADQTCTIHYLNQPDKRMKVRSRAWWNTDQEGSIWNGKNCRCDARRHCIKRKRRKSVVIKLRRLFFWGIRCP